MARAIHVHEGKSRHLALERATLLAAVPRAKVARVLPVAAALVDVAGRAVQQAVTAEEAVRDGVAAALGGHTISGLK